MWKEAAQSRRREKSGAGKQAAHKPPQATAEQVRIAQLVGDQNEDDAQLSKNVSKIVEVTGVSEEKASLALYDSNDDPSRAIELLLEKQSKGDDTGWETAGRRKNRGTNSVTRVADSVDDDSKDENTGRTRPDRGAVGRGRGRKGRVFDQNKTQEDKENESGQGGRRGGRGRSRAGPNRGRGRGAPRHNRNNRVLGGKGDENSSPFDNGRDALQEPVDMWKSTGTECWDDIEVGTWSSKDVQKQKETEKSADVFSGNWGTEAWTEDLSESRVFKAQNQVTVGSGNASGTGGGIKNEVNTNSDRLTNQTPHTGERINLGLLFKKSGTADVRNPALQSGSSYGGIVNMGHEKPAHSELTSQTKSSDHVQAYQQRGQQPFGEPNSAANSVTSRLFTDYEQPQHNAQSVSDSLFQSDDTSTILTITNSYPQLNGNTSLHNQAKDATSFLDSFSGLGSSSGQEPQANNILDQFGSLNNTRAQMPYSQSQLRIPMGKDSQMLRQAPGHTSQPESTMANIDNLSKSRDEDHLSFGSPLPPRMNQQSRQQRKKIPPGTSKIPASAVEMPGNKGYGSQDYTPFSLQFGADDPTSITDLGNHDYGINIPHSISSGIMAQQSGLFLNGENPVKTSSASHSSSNVDSLFSRAMQGSTAKSELQKIEERGNLPGVLDHTINAPPGLNMPSTMSSGLASLSTTVSSNNVPPGQHGSNFMQHGMPTDDNGAARSLDSSFHRAPSLNSSFSPQEVSSYYVTSTSNHPAQSSKIHHGPNTGQISHSPAPQSGFPENLSQNKSMQASGKNTENLASSALGSSSPSHSSNMSSLAVSLNQVSLTQSMEGQNHSRGADAIASHSTVMSNAGPYSSVISSTENRSSSPTAPSNRKPGFNTVQGQVSSSPYDNTVHNAMQNIRTSSALSPLPPNMQQSQPMSSVAEAPGSQTLAFKMSAPSTVSPTALGGFATAKMPHTLSNKGNMNVPSGVAGPIQYGIPMAGLMPYATPEMQQYGYDQLLLAQSRVVNPLNFYDMHYHGNTQAASIDGQDSSAQMNQNLAGHGKYSRGEVSSSTQMSLPGTVGSELSQHNSNIPMQAGPPKVSQSTGHHTGQQQQPYVGAAMPAYANYGSLATPYYSLGMANTGFQYPATMFAAAMHQAPKHGISTTDGYQQPTARFNHTSAITSSSGLSDLSRPNYPKTHPSGLDKQQGYHQHTNTPPPFNLQTITAAIAAGGGAATGNAAPGLGPYAAPPYMTLLQPHHASQQQTMHLLQHQHQDSGSAHSVGSQRGLGSSPLVKSAAKRGGYGSASSYWGS